MTVNFSATYSMLKIRQTPNCAGVEISGTADDLDYLWNAIHFMVSRIDDKENEGAITEAGAHILSLAYDIRHAVPGQSVFDSDYTADVEQSGNAEQNVIHFPGMSPEEKSHTTDIPEPPGNTINDDRWYFQRTWPHVLFDIVLSQKYIGK